jgi:hypothetical protein
MGGEGVEMLLGLTRQTSHKPEKRRWGLTEREKKKGWKLPFTESLSFLFLKYILNIKLKL